MGKIFLVTALHNCAINKVGIWQWQEQASAFDITGVTHAGELKLKDVPPEGIKGNQCIRKP